MARDDPRSGVDYLEQLHLQSYTPPPPDAAILCRADGAGPRGPFVHHSQASSLLRAPNRARFEKVASMLVAYITSRL